LIDSVGDDDAAEPRFERAAWPTRKALVFSSHATADGTVRGPKRSAWMTSSRSEGGSQAISELVVPRSMPTARSRKGMGDQGTRRRARARPSEQRIVFQR